MSYFIDRNHQQFGPYTLDQLRTYVASGSIYPTDLARDAQTGATTSVAALLGQVVAPPPSSPAQPYQQPYQPAQPYPLAQPQAYPLPQTAPVVPMPPNLHWAVVLLITVIFSAFGIGWTIFQMIWVRNIDKQSKALLYYGLGFVALIVFCIFGGVLIAASPDSQNPNPAGFFFIFVGFMALVVLIVMAYFDVRRSMLAYYNTVEPIGLRLSGAMTFFFNVYYFQYHMSRIASWKQTGYLTPQG